MRNVYVKEQAIAILKTYTELPVGAKAPPITGSSFDGQPSRLFLDNSSTPTIIFVISAVCPYCTQSWPTFKSVLDQASKESRPRVVFVDLTDLVDEAYLHRHRIERKAVIRNIDCETRIKYSFQITPQVIVVGRDGTIRGVWTGRLRPRDAKLVAATTLE